VHPLSIVRPCHIEFADGKFTDWASPIEHVPEVTVFSGDDTRMGCELMTGALKRSRYKLTVVGSATDSEGIRDGLRQKESNVAIISARLKEGATEGFSVTSEVRTSHPGTSVIMMRFDRALSGHRGRPRRRNRDIFP
jgi:hypothetical protein